MEQVFAVERHCGAFNGHYWAFCEVVASGLAFEEAFRICEKFRHEGVEVVVVQRH